MYPPTDSAPNLFDSASLLGGVIGGLINLAPPSVSVDYVEARNLVYGSSQVIRWQA